MSKGRKYFCLYYFQLVLVKIYLVKKLPNVTYNTIDKNKLSLNKIFDQNVSAQQC